MSISNEFQKCKCCGLETSVTNEDLCITCTRLDKIEKRLDELKA